MSEPLQGLIAATYTPMHDDESLNLDVVAPLTDRLIADGVSGLYVCGSTGEGVSLSTDEREQVAQAYVNAAADRVPVVVQVGHNSLTESRRLARHAQQIGVAAISANAPSYFKVSDVDVLIDCMAKTVSAAPDLPFYYYHIPTLTGAAVDMVALLQRAGDRIPNLAGIKFTDTRFDVFQRCTAEQDGRFTMLWGSDEMLLSALAVGAGGAVGSTYNIAAPQYRQVIDAFDRGDLDAARAAQLKAVELVRVLLSLPLHPAIKQILTWRGFDVGPCRLPHPRLTTEQVERLHRELVSLGCLEENDANPKLASRACP